MAKEKLRCGLPPHEKVFGYKGVQHTLRKYMNVLVVLRTAIRYCKEYNTPRYKENAREFYAYKDEIVKSFYGAYADTKYKTLAIDESNKIIEYPLHTRKSGK